MSKQEQAYSYSTLIRKCLLQSSRRNKQTRASVQQEQDRPGVGCFSESAGTSQSSATHRRRGAVREISLETNIVPHRERRRVISKKVANCGVYGPTANDQGVYTEH